MRSVIRRVTGALAFGVALLGARPACAAPGDATRLEYGRSERAARCPDRDALQSAVAKRLGYNPFFPAARQTIVVEIVDDDASLRAHMRLVDDKGMILGSRELSEKLENCGELVASLALAISIALDPSAALGETPAVEMAPQTAPSSNQEAARGRAAQPEEKQAEAAPEQKPPPPPKRPKRERSVHTTADAARSTSPFAVRAGVFGALGAAPYPAFGLRVGGSWRQNWLSLVVELTDQFSASHAAAEGDSVAASLIGGTLAPCAVWRSLGGCALLEVGSLKAQGIGVNEPVVARSLFVQGGARFEFTPTLVGPLRLLFNVDALKTFTPLTLRLHNQDAWRTPFASGEAGLGLELQIP